jgi:hypothetical protein
MQTRIKFITFLLAMILNQSFAGVNTLMVSAPHGQPWGQFDLDCIYLNSVRNLTGALRIEGENFTSKTKGMGMVGSRTNASRGKALIQFGCDSVYNSWAKPGNAFYSLNASGIQFIKIRYSKNSIEGEPVILYLNGLKVYEFIPKNQNSWESFTTTDWIEINCSASTLTVDPLVRTVSSASGTITFTVASNIDWSANESSDWLSVIKTNSNTLTVTYNANNTVNNRTASITFSGTGVNSVIVKLDQKAPNLLIYDTLELYSGGQDFGVFDPARLWISADKTKVNPIIVDAWSPVLASVGQLAYRSNAGTPLGKVWDNFGCISSAPWFKKSGYVKYLIPRNSVIRNYICIRYSKYSPASTPVIIKINSSIQTKFYPRNTGSWNIFTEDWIILPSGSQALVDPGKEQLILSKVGNNYITLYPVPSHEFVIFDLNKVGENLTIQLFNADGSKVRQVNNACSTVEVNLSDLRNGWYFYRICSREGKIMNSGKFIKK